MQNVFFFSFISHFPVCQWHLSNEEQRTYLAWAHASLMQSFLHNQSKHCWVSWPPPAGRRANHSSSIVDAKVKTSLKGSVFYLLLYRLEDQKTKGSNYQKKIIICFLLVICLPFIFAQHIEILLKIYHQNYWHFGN